MTFCHTYPRSSPEKALSKSRRQCACCPYGYHIDLDFVRYCESITNSQLLPEPSHRRTRWNNMRRQRASREILLGLADAPKVYCDKYSTRASEEVGDDLQKAVLDFERTLYNTSSLRRNNKKSREEENEITLRDVYVDSSETPRLIVNGTDFKMKPIHETIVNGSTNGYLAKSLEKFDRLNELEEQIRVIPLLKERIKGLQIENNKLIDQMEEQAKRPASPDKIESTDAATTTSDLSHSRNVGVGRSVLTRDIGLTVYTSPSKTVGTSTETPAGSTEKETVSLNEIIGTPKRGVHKHVHTSTDLLIRDVYTRHDLDSLKKSPPLTKTVGTCTESKTDTCNASTSTNIRIDQIYMKPEVDELIDKAVKTAEKTLMNSHVYKKVTMPASTQTTTEKKNVGVQFKVATSDTGSAAKPRTSDKCDQIHVSTSDASVYCDMTPNCCEKCSTVASLPKTKEVTKVPKGTHTLDLTTTQDASSNTIKNKLVNTSMETDDALWRKAVTTPTHDHHVQPLVAAKRPSYLPIAVNRVKPPSPKVRKPQRRHSSGSDSRSEDDTFTVKKGTASETKMDTIFQSPKQVHGNKREPSKEMKGALKVLNDALRTSSIEDIPKHVKTAVNIIQQEWFKVSSVANANPLDVEDYLDCFEEMSSLLLDYIVNMADVTGNTAMHYAVSHGNFDVVSILLDSKVCNINKMNTAGYTSIMLVALTEVKSETDREVVRRLFHLADVNIRAQEHGQTALMLAVSHGRIDTVELLLEAGADINIQDEDGSTSLMCAAEHGYVEIVKLLLAQPDCDLSLTDSDGSTALEIAMDAGNRDIGVLLYAQEHFSRGSSPFASVKHKRSKSATPTFKTSRPTTPSHSASHKVDFESFDH